MSGEEERHEENMQPDPQYGMPAEANLEVTKYLTDNKVFIYQRDHEDDDHVIEGELPGHIKRHFWAFLSKDSVLTYMRNDGDVRYVMEQLESAIISYEMRLPPGKYTYATLAHLDNLRKIVRDKTLRAMSGFERKQQSTQIQQTMYGTLDNDGPSRNPGIGARMGRLFGLP